MSRLILKWDDELANKIAADNLFRDESAERRRKRYAELMGKHGACRSDEALDAENALRGQWKLLCDRGRMDVTITLAPTMPPKVQSLRVRSVMPPDAKMWEKVATVLGWLGRWNDEELSQLAAKSLDLAKTKRQFAAAGAWGSCKAGNPTDGDGVKTTSLRLDCERGDLILRVDVDDASRLTRVELTPARDDRCVP